MNNLKKEIAEKVYNFIKENNIPEYGIDYEEGDSDGLVYIDMHKQKFIRFLVWDLTPLKIEILLDDEHGVILQ